MFHDEAVTLPTSVRDEMRKLRNDNRELLKKNLAADGHAIPEFQVQGSYAMRTMVQHKDNDYDIDDGAIFFKENLRGPNGADKSALDARKLVQEALAEEGQTSDPEIQKNCVRIEYEEGHHLDIPVYRQYEEHGATKLELAAVEWKLSNPTGVTDWFNDQLDLHSDGSDREQLRRMVRMLKAFCRSRNSWNMPSGFICTVLCCEVYQRYTRDDEAFLSLLKNLLARVKASKVVHHPVLLGETITHTASDSNMKTFEEKLQWAVEKLLIVGDSECTAKAALLAWADVFNTDFFNHLLKEEAKSFFINTGAPTHEVIKQGGQKGFA